MAAIHRRGQKTVRILEHGLRVLLEHVGDHLHRDLRGDLAVEMPAHAVGHHH